MAVWEIQYIFQDRERTRAQTRVHYPFSGVNIAQAQAFAADYAQRLQTLSDAVLQGWVLRYAIKNPAPANPPDSSDVTRGALFCVLLENANMAAVYIPSIKEELFLVDDTGSRLPVLDMSRPEVQALAQALLYFTDEYGTPIVSIKIAGLAQ